MESRREATVIASAADARRLGRYVLLGDIAEGGMGRIYLARAVGAAGFEKLFAVKVMHQGLAQRNPDIGEMFLDEARINSLVRHPNVCAVHDFGDQAGVSYLVMEFMVGQTLLEVLRRAYTTDGVRDQPLFWARAARIVAEASEGLHAAHRAVDERGTPMEVVHRDISPENVFMTYNGAVKVFDFGIAKASGRRHETATGTFKGKFAYASPEAFERGGLDWRSDIWSMGVVLWELLAGRALFHRPSETETFAAIVQEPIPTVRSVRPGCPAELDAIVTRLLARDRHDRYQSAREVARDLNRFAIKSGEHLGHGELGEWMRALFPVEFRTATERGRSVASLDDGAIDAAPVLREAPRGGLVSQVIPRDEPSPEPEPSAPLRGEPTVVHPDGIAPRGYLPYRSEDDEATSEVRIGPRGAPSPFAEEITSELRRDGDRRRAQEERDAGEAHPSSRSAGAPSPFESPLAPLAPSAPLAPLTPWADEEPPTLAAPARHGALLLGIKIGLGAVALLVGIFVADLALRPGGEPVPTTVGPSASEARSDQDATSAAPGDQTPASTATTPESPSLPPEGRSEPPAAENIVTPAPTPATTATAPGGSESAAPTDESPRQPAARPSSRGGSRTPASRVAMYRAPTAPAPAAPPSNGEPGLVNVFAVGGWADIFEGGVRLGRTPARLTLNPGRHTLVLRPSQGRPVRRVVEVPAGGNVRVRVEL